jgi:phospholipid/cholesterol/gamma-HCH transport system substrate-binding protein
MMQRGETRLGIVLLLGGTAAMLLLLLVLARYPSLFFGGREYRVVFDNAAGLNQGDEVRFGGLLVGEVVELGFHETDPTRIEVTFRVRKETPVRSDTRAQVTQLGLLGEPYLSLAPGRADSPILEEGSYIESDRTLSFQEAVNRIASFIDRADTLLAGVEAVAAAEPWARIERTLARMEDLVASTATSSERVFAQLESASVRMNQLVDRTDRLVVTIDTTLRASAPSLAATQQEIDATIREAHVLIAELREAVHAGSGVADIVRNISIASENLAALSARVERDPASIFQRREAPRKTAGPSARD